MALYNCDACDTFIQAFQPRIQCEVCFNYDLCANCALGERFGENSSHTVSHNVRTFRTSGTTQGGQLLAQAWIVYAANVQNVQTSAPPARKMSSPPSPFSLNGYSRQGGQPQQQQTYIQPPSPPMQGWQPFFNPVDMSHSSTYMTLMNALFAHLDPSCSGFFTPETFSRFEDDMGYTTAENVWKSQLANGPARADAALTATYQAFGIEYTTHPKASSAATSRNNRSSLTGFLSALATPPSVMSMSMSNPIQTQPLLTRRGFADIVAIEFLADPNKSFVLLLNVLRKYQIRELMAWGEMPRFVLPAEPDPRMLARVANVGTNQIMAAEQSARLQAMANNAAVNAIGGTQYEYVREYRYV